MVPARRWKEKAGRLRRSNIVVDEGHVAQFAEHGENLVGSRIKVCWPADESYYEGVVKSFHRSKIKPKVLYDDVDEDVLDLNQREWVLLEDGVTLPKWTKPGQFAFPSKISVDCALLNEVAKGNIRGAEEAGNLYIHLLMKKMMMTCLDILHVYQLHVIHNTTHQMNPIFRSIKAVIGRGRLLQEKYKEFGHKKAVASFLQLTDGSHILTMSIDNSTKNLYIAKVKRVVVMGLAPNGCAPTICGNITSTTVNGFMGMPFMRCLGLLKTYVSKGYLGLFRESMKLLFKSLELEDLDGLLHGSESDISVDDWKAHTKYKGHKEIDRELLWHCKTQVIRFALEEMDDSIVTSNSRHSLKKRKANSWNVIASFPTTFFYNKIRSSALFVNGELHWVVDNKLLTFHLSTHVFDMNPLPQQYMCRTMQLTNIKGSLAVISLVRFGINWVRKEHDNVASWSKLPRGKEISLEDFESYNPETGVRTRHVRCPDSKIIEMDMCVESLELLANEAW
ncbi:HECT-like protein [Artemisia annua]|uniref:HECT-like protein n=1 Tax=Artemisia annua TaxID=35608 RepID=A0A2U1L8A9_ARTAN|nr:HECT-like protein [Artemisia annua]